MLCENCNSREANVKYTQIINGVKKQMNLCDTCAKELKINPISFHIPMQFSNFLGDFFEETEEFMPTFKTIEKFACPNCHLTYDEFIQNGQFGCEECYETFHPQIDSLLKNIQGANRHIGRIGKRMETAKTANYTEKKEEKKTKKKEEKLEELKARLKQEIKEERYEEAAKTRDEIKKIEG